MNIPKPPAETSICPDCGHEDVQPDIFKHPLMRVEASAAFNDRLGESALVLPEEISRLRGRPLRSCLGDSLEDAPVSATGVRGRLSMAISEAMLDLHKGGA